MRKTGFQAVFGLYDTTARDDNVFSALDNQPFGNISMAGEDAEYPDYATLEDDFFILDGSKSEMPDSPGDVVYFSTEISDKYGTFFSPPEFIINFTEYHTSYGLTFYFVSDPPLEMEVTWCDLEGVRIARKTFSVSASGNKYFAQNQVENYGKLIIKFTRSLPYRYVKFRYIEYGTDLIIGHEGLPIKEAYLVEETDPISDKIAINKLSYKLIDEDNDFNIGNLAGIHRTLQNGQECVAYEYVDGEKMLLGRFFLSGYDTDKYITKLDLVDFKGILDNNRFLDGRVYSGESAGNVIDAIMQASGIEDYTVSDEIRAIPLYGWLKIQTCRKALREVLFACGAVADSCRSAALNMYIPATDIKMDVKRERKFSTTPSKHDYVSDITIKHAQYIMQENESQIAKGEYPAGTHTIELSSPASEMKINSGLILKQSNNYVTFKIDFPTNVTITGHKYNKEETSVTVSEKNVEAGNTRNTKSYQCSVLSGQQARQIAEKILEYYQLRLGLKIKYMNGGERPSQWAEVENSIRSFGNYVAVFEKLTTDLTGGFLTTAELRGYYKIITEDYYTGEIFAGDNFGEM